MQTICKLYANYMQTICKLYANYMHISNNTNETSSISPTDFPIESISLLLINIRLIYFIICYSL